MAKKAKNPTTSSLGVIPEQSAPATPASASSAEKVHKAFTLERVEGGWAMITITFAGDKLLSVERTEPDMKTFAIEAFKIAAFKYWGSIG